MLGIGTAWIFGKLAKGILFSLLALSAPVSLSAVPGDAGSSQQLQTHKFKSESVKKDGLLKAAAIVSSRFAMYLDVSYYRHSEEDNLQLRKGSLTTISVEGYNPIGRKVDCVDNSALCWLAFKIQLMGNLHLVTRLA